MEFEKLLARVSTFKEWDDLLKWLETPEITETLTRMAIRYGHWDEYRAEAFVAMRKHLLCAAWTVEYTAHSPFGNAHGQYHGAYRNLCATWNRELEIRERHQRWHADHAELIAAARAAASTKRAATESPQGTKRAAAESPQGTKRAAAESPQGTKRAAAKTPEAESPAAKSPEAENPAA